MSKIRFFIISIAVIVIDQLVKIAVHKYMDMGPSGEIFIIGDFFKLHYTLNPGMAFGIELGSSYGKIILTSFRIVAMLGIGYYLYSITSKDNIHVLFKICIALVLGGATGNLIDSIFYGVLFDNAAYGSPTPWLHGQVIDMFYIDIWEGMVPSWVPIFGDSFISLWPIFNIADASIFVAVCILLIFQNKVFPKNFSF